MAPVCRFTAGHAMTNRTTIPPTTHTVCDTVIADLAASEAGLLERVAELEADVVSYREVAQQAIHALADLTRDRDRQRDERIIGITENRRLGDQVTALQAENAQLLDALRQCQCGRAA